MWSIAVATLVSDRRKLLTALVGMLFSVVMVNVQDGLFLGLIQKAAHFVRMYSPHPFNSRRESGRAVSDGI
jgi:hypothetical protein